MCNQQHSIAHLTKPVQLVLLWQIDHNQFYFQRAPYQQGPIFAAKGSHFNTDTIEAQVTISHTAVVVELGITVESIEEATAGIITQDSLGVTISIEEEPDRDPRQGCLTGIGSTSIAAFG